MEEKQLTSFIKYLLKIGLLSPLTTNDFISFFNSLNDQNSYQFSEDFFIDEIYFRDKITKSIVLFINSLSDEKKKQLSVDIYTKYNENKSQQISIKLKRIIKILQLHRKRKHFLFWKRKLVMSLNLNTLKQISSQKSSKYKTNELRQNFIIGSTQPNVPLNSSRDKNSVMKSNRTSFANLSVKQKEKVTIPSMRELKEQEELSHCTFHPDISETQSYYNQNFLNGVNNKNLSYISNESVYDRLYTDHKRITERRNIKEMEKDQKFGKLVTFKPELISSSSKVLNNSSFIERNKNFCDKKSKNIEKIKSEMESSYIQNCSFSPDISVSQKSRRTYSKNNTKNPNLSQSFSSDKLPAYERLYKQSAIKKQNYIAKINEMNKEIKLASSSSIENMKDKQGNISKAKGVDYKKIEELYNSYKKGKIKIEQKRNNLNVEQGITFKPELYTNEKYYDKIKQNFYERENEFIQEKFNYINQSNQLIDDYIAKNTLGYGKYSNKEKREITNNIVQRLYVKGLEKYTERKGIFQLKKNESDDVQGKNSSSISSLNVSQLPIPYDNIMHNN